MTHTPNKVWADRIERLMKRAGVKRSDIIKSGIAKRATVYSWTHGTRFPNRVMQPKLARFLGVSVATLNGWK